MRRPPRVVLAFVVAACVPCGATAARAEWLADAEGGVVYEDNLNGAAKARDQKSDLAFVPRLSVGHHVQLTDSTSLRLTADLQGGVYTEFDRLDTVSSGLALGVRRKFGLGADAPWARVFGSAAYLNYNDGVLDSSLVSVGLELGKRLHQRFDLRAGYLYEVRDANTPVFDLTAHTAFANVSVALTEATELILGHATRWGNFTVHRRATTAEPPRPVRVVETFDTPLFAFRIDATTYQASATISQALTRDAAISVGYDYQFTQGPRLTYTNNVFRGSFTYSY
ncbi:MAG: hypothetical protein DMD82_04175 [Candidatus Rokuibacteriota bacterium]|nr:MAG: hypothetical protein DMD82_04175 [Candidatus Rokubacteria bacterium]